MSAIAYPFLRLRTADVAASPWEVVVNGELQDGAGGALRHWDYAASLSASRHIEIDIDACASALAVDAGLLELRCIVFAGSGGGRLDRMRSVAWDAVLSAAKPREDIEVEIDSQSASQSISLSTELLLMGPTESGSRLSPKQPGSRLWHDDSRFAVEPLSPRFPIEAISFSRMLKAVAADALWYVDWKAGDFDSEFSSAVRLYINEDVPAFVARVHEADELTIRLLLQGMANQLIRSALADDLFIQTHFFTPRTVGAVIASWIRRCFPQASAVSVKSIALHDPARFSAALGSTAMLSGAASNA